MIPTSWTTERTRIDSVRSVEAELLASLFNSSADIAALDPSFQPVGVDEVLELVRESERAEAMERGFRMQAIRLRPSDELVGYFHFREGAARPDVVGLTMFVIGPAFRSQGYGREVVDALIDQLSSDTANRVIWARVYLKNVPALRFWTGRGFTHVVRHKGQHVHLDRDEASVILERTL